MARHNSAAVHARPVRKLMTCPSACTPASVRPAAWVTTRPPSSRASAASTSPWTVRSAAWRCQPAKPCPTYSRTANHVCSLMARKCRRPDSLVTSNTKACTVDTLPGADTIRSHVQALAHVRGARSPGGGADRARARRTPRGAARGGRGRHPRARGCPAGAGRGIPHGAPGAGGGGRRDRRGRAGPACRDAPGVRRGCPAGGRHGGHRRRTGGHVQREHGGGVRCGRRGRAGGEARQPVVHVPLRVRGRPRSARHRPRPAGRSRRARAAGRGHGLPVRARLPPGHAVRRPRAPFDRRSHRHEPGGAAGEPRGRTPPGGGGGRSQPRARDGRRAAPPRHHPRAGRARGRGDGRDLPTGNDAGVGGPGNDVRPWTMDAADFGVRCDDLSALAGGEPAANAARIEALLRSPAGDPAGRGRHRAQRRSRTLRRGRGGTFGTGMAQASAALADGRAWRVLEALRRSAPVSSGG
jgi:hypothetical protein